MATAAVTVYWPRSDTARHHRQQQQNETKQYALLGFRVDTRTICVVELVPTDGSDLTDDAKGAGAEVIGVAEVVSAEQHDAFLHQEKPAEDAMKKNVQLRVHLVVHSSVREGRLASLVTSLSTTTTKEPPTPAVVFVETGGAANDNGGERSESGVDHRRAIRHCDLVFYDARLAAKGCLARCARALPKNSAFRAPLMQIDSVFARRLERESPKAQTTSALDFRGLAETVGFYLIFVPSTFLLRVAATINAAVTAQVPASVPVIGGKCAKDRSRFLEVLSCHVHSLARVPGVVRSHYLASKGRRVTDAEVGEAIEAWNYGWYVAMDAAVGRLLAEFAFQILLAQLQAREWSPAAFLEILRANVVWLMGAPAGFKLNAPLASILGNGILLWFDLWEYTLSLLIGSDAPWTHPLLQSSWAAGVSTFVWRNMGATLQLTLLADVLSFFTWNSYWVYQYFTKLNMLQFGLLSSLWKLFLGKKNNVLRKRVDSCEYGVSQLLLGTLLFTILFFIVTTNMVFFVYFGLVRLSIFLVQAALWSPVVCLRTLPVASVLYRWWNPTFFVAGVRLETRNELAAPTKTLEIHDVGVGKKRSSDAQAQQRISEITTRGGVHDNEGRDRRPRNAYFQVVPIAPSPSSLFSRWRAYSNAISTRYALGAVVRSWFFGSHISPIPLTLLFDSPVSENCDSTSERVETSVASASRVSRAMKKNL